MHDVVVDDGGGGGGGNVVDVIAGSFALGKQDRSCAINTDQGKAVATAKHLTTLYSTGDDVEIRRTTMDNSDEPDLYWRNEIRALELSELSAK